MENIARSRKSRIKKRSEDWESMKVEIAKELGLWPKVAENGWAGLSAADSGKLGGVFAARKKAAARRKTDR
ncbi:MAG: small, acid-soluble spore protein, alpha/beta type [Firmicutes bacterium]|nr:small, acid-soluble spore protein, alpha/beta type [Bacillota bacterium]